MRTIPISSYEITKFGSETCVNPTNKNESLHLIPLVLSALHVANGLFCVRKNTGSGVIFSQTIYERTLCSLPFNNIFREI